MSDRQEAVADVLAKMRNFACVGKGHEGTCSDIIESYADRIEAACEREECSRRGAEAQSGNAAMLREALKYLRDASREFCHLILNSKYSEVFDKYKYAEVAKIRYAIANANSALAAPQRNCDVGTARQQEKRHKEEACLKSACPKDEGFVSKACKGCFAMWSQMPYKGGAT